MKTPNPRGSARHVARVMALQSIYAWLISDDKEYPAPADVDEIVKDEQGNRVFVDMPLVEAVLQGTVRNAQELRNIFVPFVDRDLRNLSPVEHGILLLATYELKYMPETPYRVIINEAVELAKEFGGTSGYRFINGVVDKVALCLRAEEIERARSAQ